MDLFPGLGVGIVDEHRLLVWIRPEAGAREALEIISALMREGRVRTSGGERCYVLYLDSRSDII